MDRIRARSKPGKSRSRGILIFQDLELRPELFSEVRKALGLQALVVIWKPEKWRAVCQPGKRDQGAQGWNPGPTNMGVVVGLLAWVMRVR